MATLLPASFLLAQNTSTIRGFVYDQDNGEPVIFTNVMLRGKSLGAATDVNGYFSISRIPAGDYTLMVTSLGYDTLTKAVSLAAGQILTEKLFVVKTKVELKTFTVTAEKTEAQTQVRMSVTKLDPKQI
ncbi:MAG TPA: carboxypeptidase-like regulatory domain-containing protein, partial [Flavobacteriales bacterium]|nr:carboxypeptidase-like regulatory domain-containing protein [Flavobacteriales bacterium]